MATMTRIPIDAGGSKPVVPGRVLGIDPGLNVTGYAILEPGSSRPRVVEAGVIRVRGGTSGSLGSRLETIFEGILEILDLFPPSAMALEQVHSHARFPRAALMLAHARGVICLAAETRNVPVVGYAATRIKKTLTGSGRAPKDQMQHAIRVELGLDKVPEPHDVADACAVALCHYQLEKQARGTSWRP